MITLYYVAPRRLKYFIKVHCFHQYYEADKRREYSPYGNSKTKEVKAMSKNIYILPVSTDVNIRS